MNSPTLAPTPTVADAATPGHQEPPKAWLLVTQYRSDRLIYFTDDLDFTLPADADWCYVSPYQGELPEGMTLRNCWSWRFRGMAFVDARQPKPPNPAQALLDHNKEALRRLLRDKVEAMRRPVTPHHSMGHALRAAKLAEAHAVLAGEATAQRLRLLPQAAAVRRITLAEMANLVLAAHAHTEEVLLHSELLREELAVAIDQARSQTELTTLRSRLMEELAPQAGLDAAVQPEHTTPQAQARRPSAEELAQEQLRLRVQLRLKVNDLRRPLVSEYLLDDVVLRHKGRVAEAVLKAGGALPPGMEGGPLISHAAARGQTLAEAAQEVVLEMADAAQMLLKTEQMKEALLARIAGVETFGEVGAVGEVIGKLGGPAVRNLGANASATSID